MILKQTTIQTSLCESAISYQNGVNEVFIKSYYAFNLTRCEDHGWSTGCTVLTVLVATSGPRCIQRLPSVVGTTGVGEPQLL